MVNKVTFVGFSGAIAVVSTPWIRPWCQMILGCAFVSLLKNQR